MAAKKQDSEVTPATAPETAMTVADQAGTAMDSARPLPKDGDLDAMMDASASPVGDLAKDAGAGSDDLGVDDIILPRISLLQSMSQAVTEKRPGAEPGVWWMTPQNRPVTLKADDFLRFVPVKVYPAQRRWTPLDQGGGVECAAETGKLIAREPNGLAGATLMLDMNKKDEVTSVDWEGGHPTDRCTECVYGPGAGAAAQGKEPSGLGSKGNPWLPKIIDWEGKQVKLPDDKRAPKCTASVDSLALVAVPAFNGMPPTIEPCFISFSRTSQPAGKQLAGMVKLASNSEPTWAKIYTLGAKKVTNDKGTFFVATCAQFGYAKEKMMDMAKSLYHASQSQTYRADQTDMKTEQTAPQESNEPAPRDDAPAPADTF